MKSKRKTKKKNRTKSRSPVPTLQHQTSAWNLQHHQQRMKQIQQNKLQMARKIETANLSIEARKLLQEQQSHFQFEQQVIYGSVKHEYDKLHYQLQHYVDFNKQLIKSNHQLKHDNMALKAALKYGKVGDAHNYHHKSNAAIIVTKKAKPESKHKREFKKWFKREIGSDFMEYFDKFAEAGFDDLRTVRHILHESELSDLGIDKKGHRLHIMDKIENYRLQYNQSNQADVAQPAAAQNGHSPAHCAVSDEVGFSSIDAIDMEGNTKTE